LYNSNLIHELLLNPETPLSDFFVFNTVPVPNWIGHFILSIFNFILPAFIAEKALMILYLFFLPWSFRHLTQQYNNSALSYLIFPFSYTFLFYLGFYNLSISFILLFGTLALWKKHNSNITLKFAIALFVALSLTYFAHAFVYSILLFIIFLTELQNLIGQYSSSKDIRTVIGNNTKKYIVLLIAALPSLLLLLQFFNNVHFSDSDSRLPASELIKWIKDVRPLIALNYEGELRFTEIYYHLLIALTTITLFVEIQNNLTEYKSNLLKSLLRISLLPKNVFLAGSLLFLILFFTVPNSSSAGMMSDRLALIFFIFIVVWLATNTYPSWLSKTSIVIILYVNFGLVFKYTKSAAELSATAEAIYEAQDKIQPYSTVLPIKDTDHWLQLHFSNYLGVDKPMVILENYEASVGWFPLKWVESGMKNLRFGNLSSEECSFGWKSGSSESEEIAMIDYVLVWGYANTMNDLENNALDTYYSLVYSSEDGQVRLFELKESYR